MDNNYSAIFNETVYEALLPTGTQLISLNNTNAWLDDILNEKKKDTWAFITAFNPLPKILASDINNKRQDELIQIVENWGYTYFKGHGRAPDNSWIEECVLILGISLTSAIEIGNDFGQMAILFGKKHETAEIVYCKKSL